MNARASVNRLGCTRIVILIGPYAVKVPRFGYRWDMGLRGLLCNMQERAFSKAGWPELCPVILALPGGWLNIMCRARPLTGAEWAAFDVTGFLDRPDYHVPAEPKADSFGVLDGRIVAVDYGE